MSKLPLSGIRVLELGHAWAGPHSVRILCDLGAEVIKIESPEGDPLRGGKNRNSKALFITKGQGGDQWNLGAVYNQVNRGKLCVGMDLTREEGHTVFNKLLKMSDIVVYNLVLGAVRKLRIGYEELKAVKPEIILVTMTGYGFAGPWSEYRTYGVVLEPMCGFFSLTGYLDDEAPIRSGVDHIDPLSGAHAAGAALAALLYRQRTGKGQWINLSFLESGVNFVGSEILEYTMNSHISGHSGNKHHAMSPHGCYRCRGEDQWVAIAVGSDDEWKLLCQTMGNPSWTMDKRFSTSLERLKNQDELDSLVESWTKQRDKHEIMDALQKAGVPAGAVLDMTEVLHNPHLRNRDFFHEVQRPDIGRLEVIGTRAKLSKTPTYVRGPAPRYGEHSNYVFGNLLGMSQPDINELTDKGIICMEPI